MAAGNKKYVIEVYSVHQIQTESGSIEDTELNLKHKLKAEVKFNSNSISILNDEIVQTDRVTFRIYKRDIDYKDIVKFEGSTYEIVSINPLSYSNELEIICEKINE